MVKNASRMTTSLSNGNQMLNVSRFLELFSADDLNSLGYRDLAIGFYGVAG